VESAQLQEGRYYAFRDSPVRRGSPLLKVKLMTKLGRRGHVKIRYDDARTQGLRNLSARANHSLPRTASDSPG
jgi:hypothetical protein